MVYPEGTDVADLYNNLCEFFSEKKKQKLFQARIAIEQK